VTCRISGSAGVCIRKTGTSNVIIEPPAHTTHCEESKLWLWRLES
jgi:hypothetical protein